MRVYIKRSPARIAADLPTECYSRLPGTGSPIMIRRGVKGFDAVHRTTNVERRNGLAGVTAAQVVAMTIGAIIGFDRPEADPINHDGHDACRLEGRARWRWAGQVAETMGAQVHPI